LVVSVIGVGKSFRDNALAARRRDGPIRPESTWEQKDLLPARTVACSSCSTQGSERQMINEGGTFLCLSCDGDRASEAAMRAWRRSRLWTALLLIPVASFMSVLVAVAGVFQNKGGPATWIVGSLIVGATALHGIQTLWEMRSPVHHGSAPFTVLAACTALLTGVLGIAIHVVRPFFG
jgi:hypothetical protein